MSIRYAEDLLEPVAVSEILVQGAMEDKPGQVFDPFTPESLRMGKSCLR